MPQPIVIVDYDPEWTAGFKEEASKILGAIGDKLVAIEHIGSTAVPGLGCPDYFTTTTHQTWTVIPCLLWQRLCSGLRLQLGFLSRKASLLLGAFWN